MKKNYIASSLLAGILLLGITSIANANLIENGGFESSNVKAHGGKWQQFSNIADWSSDDKTEIQTNLLFGPAAEGDQYVELDSKSGDGNDWLTQTFSTVANQTYEFSFAFSARQNRTENVLEFGIFSGATLNDWLYENSISANGKGLKGTDWNYFTYSFVADSDFATIAFRDGGRDDSYGTFIDDVSVAPVPEPGTMLLFGAGLAGLVGVNRRRKK